MAGISDATRGSVKMDLTEDLKNQIDGMNYEAMMSKWRFAPIGDPLFQGESGTHFSKVIAEKRDKISDAERVEASKNVGWVR